MPKFFIDRPIFAWVISLFIMLAGFMALLHLPVAEYPSVAPPSIAITATYAGASAETVQNTVTEVIEEQMNGLDHLLYMSSSSSSSGQSQIHFISSRAPTPDLAQVQVQNKLQLAIPSLPHHGPTGWASSSPNPRATFLMFFALSSTNGDGCHRAGQLYFAPPCWTPSAASAAWARPTCSVPNTPCASGSIQKNGGLRIDRRDVIAAVQAQNARCRWASSACCPP